ncbi:uncharacterized protein LOC115450108 isoform X1 [Manduca sexta]|uniref:BED-type domain-containing protein n=1 Tax=Manduca sexta TaxID=7130 RepID=A0A922CW57_MANSE|nr:uncharacterized protein LOC115450108 isoform X1 [Manduca sexta]KAG6460341.1 hypothetical protein O3G_MSEX011923 [Manduca sexta]
MSGSRKTSIAWKYFTDIGNDHAVCKICNEFFSYKTSVSNLKKHIIRKHPSVLKNNSPSESSALIDHEYRTKGQTESNKDASSVDIQDSNDEYETIEIQQEDIQDETTDPMFVEFLEHTGSSPANKIENSPSPPPIASKRKRMRYSYSRAKEEHRMDPRHLLEIKRLELETLREKNLNEKERIRAQLDRDSLKVQERLVTFLEDIKPALIEFLRK